MNSSQPLQPLELLVERPPFNPIPFIYLPPLVFSAFVALRPNTTWRVIGFLVYLYWSIRGTQYTTGSAYENYLNGCTFGGGCVVAFYDLFLTDPMTEWRHNSEPTARVTDMPYWKRAYWILCAGLNNRGIGWSFEVTYIPTLPSHDRWHFVKRRVCQVLWNLLLVDVAQTYERLNPLFALTGDAAKSVWSQGYPIGCINIVARLTVSWGLLNLPYDVLSIVCVALGIHEPQNWPDVFGDWSDSYTIRRFWSRTWHQWFRRYSACCGKFFARHLSCKPGSWLSSRVQLIFGFTISALSHVPGDMMVNPKFTGSSLPFFAWQVLGITFEDFVIDVGKFYAVKETLWVHIVGWLWTFGWFSFSAATFVNWTFPAGNAKQELFQFSLVQPLLERVVNMTDVDLLTHAPSVL